MPAGHSMPRAISTLAGRRARLRLAAASQSRLERLAIGPADAPERQMLVSFEGLTPEEQRAALAAFPGGRRFVLA